MHSHECFVNKIFEITKNIDGYIDRRIREENLPILRSHISIFNVFPSKMVPLSFNEILKKGKFSKSSLSEILTKYETMGFLNRVSCDYDKRSVYILLTEEGLKVKHKGDKILSEVSQNLLSNFNLNEEELINSMIDNMYSNSKNML